MTLRGRLLRALLRVGWTVGGAHDPLDGLPRLRGDGLGPLLAALRPGDIVLLGNNGGLSHVAVHEGEGRIVHAMATERTMRGWAGSLWDALQRLLGAVDPNVGVLREPLAAFVDRFERDTFVALRWPDLTDEERARGLERIAGLVGRPYDYAFGHSNEAWYCTEIVDEFLRAAIGERTPRWERRRVRVPLLLDAEVVEPIALLRSRALRVVDANEPARARYSEWL